MLKPDLKVPEQKIASLSFSDTSPKAFRAWVSHLPMANLGELSRQLYHAIIELNQLFIAPGQRLQLLELIRPKIRFVCDELSRHYLGMAISLPEKQRKIANLSQALQLHAAAGYKLCILELIDNGGPERNKRALIVCCHRAISELGATVLRASQLYGPSPVGSWHEAHQLYQFAMAHGLHDTQVPDESLQHRAGSSVAEAYKQLLLFGCARANQLRQSEMEQAYHLLELWADKTRCARELASSALFIVNTGSDQPAVFRDLVPDSQTGTTLGFDSGNLAGLLETHLQNAEDGRKTESPIRVPAGTSDTLISHLSGAFGMLAKRNFNRLAAEGSLEVCAGLTSVHYFVSGQNSFSNFISGNEAPAQGSDNRFMKPDRRDAWATAHDAGTSDERIMASADAPINFQRQGFDSDALNAKNRPNSYLTRLVNTSPGGYCVVWSSGDIPAALQAGEILGVREQKTHPWSIAVVRWLRQTRSQGTRVGIELLAPNASPCGVRLIQKTGQNSEFLRALLLPEIAALGLPPSVVTPKLPFQVGSRVVLLHDQREDQGILGKRVEATGSISQFQLRLYNQAGTTQESRNGEKPASEDEFDSLWPSL
ncbi:GTPase [uncultured Marinobacter sp.]|mgnify:CR=1 FL=1|uniref:GTPase n=1 Tax=uncultured Marinobacter sp. TaxID=187379 RepID=UPI0030D88051